MRDCPHTVRKKIVLKTFFEPIHSITLVSHHRIRSKEKYKVFQIYHFGKTFEDNQKKLKIENFFEIIE